MSPASPGASSWLRSRTRDEHAAAEAALDLDRLREPADLARLLRGWAAVWDEVRRAAGAPAAAAAATTELEAPAAQALSWLRADLRDLGELTDLAELDDLVALTDLAELTDPGAPADGSADPPRPVLTDLLADPAGAWGVAYVLRGSRLGGRVIAAAVGPALGLTAGRGTAFLASAGTDPGAEWVAFRRRLDSLVRTPDELAAAGAAASWTFGWVGSGLAAGLAAPPLTV